MVLTIPFLIGISMEIDCTDYPSNYIFTEVVAKNISVYVNVANFTTNKDRTCFRLLTDSILSEQELLELMSLRIIRKNKIFDFSTVDVVIGKIVDNSSHRSETTPYLRFTYDEVIMEDEEN